MIRLFAVAGLAGLLFTASPAFAAQATHEHGKQACCDMPCCKDAPKVEQANAEPTIIDMLFAAGFAPVGPVRQEVTVWFMRPVLVGQSILQGQYIIQHDNERMARGEPCTHIYAYDDRTKPVVKFNCTHLERDRAGQNQVVLFSAPAGLLTQFAEFQFAGETAAHGYPKSR